MRRQNGFIAKLLESEPWNELIRGQLATVQVAENKLPEAISTLDAVLLDPKLRDLPKHPLLNYVRALAAFRQKDYAAAQSNAATVVAKVPGFERARLMAGAASYALKCLRAGLLLSVPLCFGAPRRYRGAQAAGRHAVAARTHRRCRGHAGSGKERSDRRCRIAAADRRGVGARRRHGGGPSLFEPGLKTRAR